MKTCAKKSGFTLIEAVVVVGIIILLVAMVVNIAARIDHQAKERLTRATMAIIEDALDEFRNYGYKLKKQTGYPNPGETEFYRSLNFPIDCNGFLPNLEPLNLNRELAKVFDLAAPDEVVITGGGTHDDPKFSGCEVMYLFLSLVPESKKTLDMIDKSLLTNRGSNNGEMNITIGVSTTPKTYPLMRVLDAWGTTLKYDYYREDYADFNARKGTIKTFPVLISAGPDKTFDTPDDIESR